MEKEFIVLQGNSFVVDIYNVGDYPSGCAWSLSSLPEGIFLTSMEYPPAGFRGKGLTRFIFMAVSGEQTERSIKFVRINLRNHTEIYDEYQVNVIVIPSNSEEFVNFSENATNAAIPYGVVYGGDSLMKYGYPCTTAEPMVKYGYPCGTAEPMVKYGYPCTTAEPMVKYGYSCGMEDERTRNGSYCRSEYPVVKYGYPCAETSMDVRAYGYPYYV